MQLVNTAEGGSNGSAVTTGNSGSGSGSAWNSVSSSSSTVEFSTSQSVAGSFSYRLATGGTSATANLIWDSSSIGSPTHVYGRVYFRLPAANVDREIARWRRGTTQVARLRFNGTSSVLELRQGNNSAPATSGGTGTVTLSANTWYRVEWDIQAGTLTNTIYLYAGDSTTPLETITGNGVFATGGVINEVGFGQFTAAASLGDLFLDAIVLNDTGLPGPTNLSCGVSESLAQSDAFAAISALRVPMAAALSSADTPSFTQSTGVAADAALTIDDDFSTVIGYGVGGDVGLTVEDDQQAIHVVLVDVAEAVAADDAPAAPVDRARGVAETSGLGNTVVRQLNRTRGQAQALTAVDSPKTTRALLEAVAEGVGIGNSLGRVLLLVRVPGEGVQLAHDMSRGTLSRSRSAAEGVGLGNAWLAARQIIPTDMTLEVAFSDSAVAFVGRPVAVGQSMDVSNTARVSGTRSRSVSQPLAAGHAVAAAIGKSLEVSTPMTLDEVLEVVGGQAAGAAASLVMIVRAGMGGAGGVLVIAYRRRARMTAASGGQVRLTGPPRRVRLTEGG